MSGESLTALLRRTKQTLCVPAAEYVPAMGDAMLLLDRAIQMSYQTDPCWLSSSAAERAVVEALEMAEGTLLIASRMLTEDHKMVLNGKRWGDKTIKAVNAALSSVRGEGGDKQARSPSALSAPISTDTKGTTK